MDKWHIQEPPLLREIFKEPLLISYRESLKDMLVLHNGRIAGVAFVCQPYFNHQQKTTTKARLRRRHFHEPNLMH